MRPPVVFLVALLVAACGPDDPERPVADATSTVAVASSTIAAAEATSTAVRLAPSCAPNQPGDTTLRFASSGGDRTALVHVPVTAAAARVPVILDYHGHGGTAEVSQRRHGFDAVAEPLGAITVYAQGVVQLDGAYGWHTGAPNRDSGLVDDVQYTIDLLDLLESTWCIDPDRIWVTGHSNGGGMVGVLACEAADRIDAVAAVAGAFYRRPGCAPARPVPFLEIHGLADETVPYAGNALFDPMPEFMALVAERNGCGPEPAIDGLRSIWADCEAPVEHLALPDQGHAYPAEAAAWIVEFFGRLP